MPSMPTEQQWNHRPMPPSARRQFRSVPQSRQRQLASGLGVVERAAKWRAREHAAIAVQSTWRGYSTKHKVKPLLFHHRALQRRGATLLQALIRGHLDRWFVAGWRARAGDSAGAIQRMARGMLARRRVAELKTGMSLAAEAVQRLWRGYRTRAQLRGLGLGATEF